MKDCVFCKIVAHELPSETLYETEDILAFLDIKPINPGHALVIPKKHFESIHDTPDELMAKIILVSKKIANVIQQTLGAEGVNIAMNNGKAAGQIVFHAHIHVMPRYSKDAFKLWTGKDYKNGEKEVIANKIKEGMIS